MKILALTPEALAGLGAPDPEAEGPPEYAISIPVPSPEGSGEYVLLTVTPDGRTAAVLVDRVSPGELTVVGWLASEVVTTFPKEAPWMLLKRALVRFMTKDEIRKATTQAYQRLGACPVHGDAHREVAYEEPRSAEDPERPGQYL